MATPRKKFSVDVPAEYSGNTVGIITLVCIAYLYHDGTFRTLDINEAIFNGKDVADYVSATQPDVWDEWLEQAETHIREQLEGPDEIPDDNYADHERPSTLF